MGVRRSRAAGRSPGEKTELGTGAVDDEQLGSMATEIRSDEVVGKAALRRARFSVAAAFVLTGLVFASWIPRIPAVKATLGLSNGQLGLALLGPALGSLLSMRFVGSMVAHRGSRFMMRRLGPIYCLLAIGPGLANGLVTLTLSLVIWGAFMGGLDVSMNAHAVAVELRHGRPIMSSFHGWFSIGGFTGAAIGGLAARAHLSVRLHLTITALVSCVVAVVAFRGLLPAGVDRRSETSERPPTHRQWHRPAIIVGLLALFGMVGEGASADWSGVYLHDRLGVVGGGTALAFAAFSITMTVGRFTGDRIIGRFGPARTGTAASTLAAVGFAGAVSVASPIVAVSGFALAGVGLSVMVPIFFSAAGSIDGVEPGDGLSQVTTIGYAGMLLGPPIIGGLAQLTTLRTALILPSLLAALAAATVGPAIRSGRRAP